MGRPAKIKRPVGLDAALLRILRGKRSEDRLKIFRAWRMAILQATFKREPTDEEIQAEFQLFRKPDFDAANLNPFFWDSLKDFVPAYQKENRIKKARIAAAKRWSKKNEKTS